MTLQESITALLSILAVIASLVSLVRTRKYNDLQLELESISAQLAEKQLSKMLESEEREGQPIFAIRKLDIVGLGDPDSPDYRVYIKFSIDNSGADYYRSGSC